MAWLIILSRWVHVVSACVALGGVFFVRIVLRGGARLLAPDVRDIVQLRIRRTFKMVIHSTILLLLLSGSFNSYIAWNKYQLNPMLMHPLWGTHLLLALIAIAIALYLLAGKTPRPSNRKWLTLNLIVLLAAVAAASTLKWARDTASSNPPGATP
ncbi:MAG: hypothetical protein ABSF29_11450 [Tepidisphaeraceae bacterium]|jgi:uncharacterized membrane protein